MHVEIYQLVGKGEDRTAGVLRLQDGKIVCEPADSKLLAGILAEPLYDPRANKVYDAETMPEEWLRHLCRQYRGAYLRASAVMKD